MVDNFSGHIDILSQCPLFDGLDLQRLSGILKKAGARTESYDSGSMVRQQGDAYRELIILVRGKLEARFDSASGKGLTVEYFNAPSMVASAVLMSSEPILPVSLIADSKAVLVLIPTEGMLSVMAEEPTMLKAFLQDAGDKVRFLAEKIRLLRFDSLRRKIASHLLTLSREQRSERVRWRYGREQMAELLGVARPSLSRELSRMTDQGLLEMPDRSYVVIDAAGLKTVLVDD